MPSLKLFSLALVMLAGIGAASAATIQDSRGTFIQDRNGVWHQYVLARPGRILADPDARNGKYPYQYPGMPTDLDVPKGDQW